MGRQYAHDTGQNLFAINTDLCTGHGTAVNTANGGKVQEAVTVDFGNHHTDLINMRVKKKLDRSILFAHKAVNTAEGIGFYRRAEGKCLFRHSKDRFFIARSSRRVAKIQ